jgi:hypothetical protein
VLIQLAEKAESTGSHKFLIESNSIRRSARHKKEEIATLTLTIDDIVLENFVAQNFIERGDV